LCVALSEESGVVPVARRSTFDFIQGGMGTQRIGVGSEQAQGGEDVFANADLFS
jgi:hypothetical protein